MFLLVGAIQFVVIALPVSIFVSKGLHTDANRSCFFYATTGLLLGIAPWLVVALIGSNGTFTPIEDTVSLLYPGLSTGLFAGVMLKHQLTKLAAGAGIESCPE
jgi:hypothetical protein